MKKEEIARLHAAMKNVNLSEGQTMQVLRYANRVPLQFQQAGCSITQAVTGNNWRAYGLPAIARSVTDGARDGDGAHGQRVGAVHERVKRGIASYPEILKELRLALQAVEGNSRSISIDATACAGR